MSVSVDHNHLWEIPFSPGQQSLEEGGYAQSGSASRRLGALLKLTIGLLIVLLLLGIVWVAPVT